MTILHFGLSIFYYYKSFNKQPYDAFRFFNEAVNSGNWFEFFGLGSKLITFLIFPFVKLQLSYFTIFIIFAFIGFLGYLNYFKILGLKERTYGSLKTLIILCLFLLPSLHYWTSSISKEAILFFLTTVLIKEWSKNKVVSKKIIISLTLCLFVRPYYFFIILLAKSVALLFKKELFRVKKTFFLGAGVIALVAMPVLISFLKIENFDSFINNYRRISEYALNNGNSSINLLESNYLERLILVLSRPLFIDATSFSQFVISFENLILLLFYILFLYSLKQTKFAISKFKLEILVVFITALLLILFYSIYMYNLGLASRMRVMFIPLLLFVFIAKNEQILNTKN
ncbi:hypothetical protein [Winogradskyella sp.]|uniref:hypothetical protein n=1 Tax=Winogradskyella sp. TaxID=1883156 RepID=UPI0025F56BE5|nr:hypothetical protein [Winogradskyella sp.]